ncbi:RelA/SpoT family protein [Bradyrhizobium sp. 197]|uniref:GTP pyrophosphokinase n=1 Tax=Bradyrhizobium sp. 197 TaxID=2782663 RepID=UPI001FFB73CE|nr:RelA/SpoT family protein [Bradyrhizobium sp. 197]MCK1479911.1 RelA/SpoT family protein [Bradyrhizobium sp. 197]
MNREQEFLERWRRESPAYSAWGKYVVEKLSGAISEFASPVALEVFLKIPVKARLKAEDSLLQKAFHRGKGYENPYEEIEDKVGIRYVVLLGSEVKKIDDAILGVSDWIAEKARDYVQEQMLRPYEFDYQSLHYIVRSRNLLNFDSVEIPADTPCEIQVRTLLQHAYSELTHDTIYKPNVQATPSLKRSAAKSMALIEATGDYFAKVHEEIQAALVNSEQMSMFLDRQYRSWIGLEASHGPLQSLIVDHYARLVGQEFEASIEDWWSSKQFVRERIVGRSKDQVIYRVSGILLVYYCVSTFPNAAKENSPLSDDELGLIYSDLGRSLN